MGVTYELIDAPYPYLCAVYRCPCGEVAVRHADQAAVPPPGWWEHEHDGVDDCLCPRCSEVRAVGGREPSHPAT